MKLKRESYQRGSLRKVERANSFAWELRYRVSEDGTRKLKQVTLCGKDYPSEAAARRKLDALLLDVNATSQPEFQDVVLGELITAYKETEMPERPKSAINYKLLLDRHILPRWSASRLSQINPYQVEIWLAGLQYAPETKRHIRNMLYRLFEFAMRRGFIAIQRNPIELVRVKGSTRSRELVVLTPEQMAFLIESLSDPYRLMVQLAAFLGLRISEVLGLQWGDIDHQRRVLTVRRSAVDGNVAETKTAASYDALPLAPEMLSLLERWREQAPASKSGWVFPSPINGGPQHAGSLLKRQIKPVARAMNLPTLGWHSLRHTYRSWLDAVGTPVGVQQKMMRHADISTTMNRYGTAMLESKRQAHAKVLEFAGVSGVGVCGARAVG